jgi:hypothetical protein
LSSADQYEVLNPWAEVDPVPLKGLAPRPDSLDGKRIGLYCNFKVAARQMLTALETKLKERFPACEFRWYHNPMMGVAEIESERKAKFEEWISNIDTAIFAVGD